MSWDPPRLVRHPAGWAIQVSSDTTVFGKTLASLARHYRYVTGRDMVLVATDEEDLCDE